MNQTNFDNDIYKENRKKSYKDEKEKVSLLAS